MNNRVYVASAHYFSGETIIIGVYYNYDDARRICEEWENEHIYCAWAEWESFEIQ